MGATEKWSLLTAPHDGWCCSLMAGCTVARRAFEQRDGSPGDALLPFMAQPARDVLMRPAKRESGAGLVVEPCCQPPARGVTASAIHVVATAFELAPMNVLVTAHALARNLEWDLSRTSLRIQRPVAIQAAKGQVSAGQREVR